MLFLIEDEMIVFLYFDEKEGVKYNDLDQTKNPPSKEEAIEMLQNLVSYCLKEDLEI